MHESPKNSIPKEPRCSIPRRKSPESRDRGRPPHPPLLHPQQHTSSPSTREFLRLVPTNLSASRVYLHENLLRHYRAKNDYSQAPTPKLSLPSLFSALRGACAPRHPILILVQEPVVSRSLDTEETSKIFQICPHAKMFDKNLRNKITSYCCIPL